MKIWICLLWAALSALQCAAQQPAKSIIGIIPFNYQESTYKKQAEQLQNIVTRVFNANTRISLLDRSKVSAIQKELNLQKDKEYINGKTVKQNKAYGAQYIIIGNLTSVEIEKSKFSGINPFNKNAATTTTTSKCKVSFTLQKIDVTTGELNATKVFDVASNGAIETENFKKESDPFKNAIEINSEKINHEVRAWVAKLFPPLLKFHGLEEKDKKGIPKFVALVTESDNPIQPGDLISVLEIEPFEFEGVQKHRRTEVSVLKVKEVQGDVLKCAILTGGKVIEEKTKGPNKLEFVQKDN